MWNFIIERGPGIATGLFALAAQVSGYTNIAIAAGLLGLAAFFFVAPICHHAHAWHKRRLSAGYKAVEPIHLITVGLAGVLIFAAVALGGIIWQSFSERPGTAAASASVTTPKDTTEPVGPLSQRALRELSSFFNEKVEPVRIQLKNFSEADFAANYRATRYKTQSYDVGKIRQDLSNIGQTLVELKTELESYLTRNRLEKKRLEAILGDPNGITQTSLAIAKYSEALSIAALIPQEARDPIVMTLDRPRKLFVNESQALGQWIDDVNKRIEVAYPNAER